MSGARYLVCNENTLCYWQPGGQMLGVLAGKVLKGGRDWRDGVFMPGISDTLREATDADFADYRVCAKGFIANGLAVTNPNYGIF